MPLVLYFLQAAPIAIIPAMVLHDIKLILYPSLGYPVNLSELVERNLALTVSDNV